jgi:hypothetical protein
MKIGTCAEVTSVEYCYQRNWHKQAVTLVIIGLGSTQEGFFTIRAVFSVIIGLG